MDNNDEVCDCCGELLDQFAENGYCFNCLMDSCTPGNYTA